MLPEAVKHWKLVKEQVLCGGMILVAKGPSNYSSIGIYRKPTENIIPNINTPRYPVCWYFGLPRVHKEQLQSCGGLGALACPSHRSYSRVVSL